MGGKTYRAIWGGGGNVLWSAPSKTNFGGLRRWDWSGLCPFPLKKITGCEQRGGGGKRIQETAGILFREYFFGEENSLSLTQVGVNEVSSANFSVSSLWHSNNRLRGTH